MSVSLIKVPARKPGVSLVKTYVPLVPVYVER